ncbi:hypothetical protein ERJ75_001269800 [Trypanosoma vivax]|nr:hypothetical protein ERJ75_001269800 [Trypanosoma vivax]
MGRKVDRREAPTSRRASAQDTAGFVRRKERVAAGAGVVAVRREGEDGDRAGTGQADSAAFGGWKERNIGNCARGGPSESKAGCSAAETGDTGGARRSAAAVLHATDGSGRERTKNVGNTFRESRGGRVLG